MNPPPPPAPTVATVSRRRPCGRHPAARPSLPLILTALLALPATATPSPPFPPLYPDPAPFRAALAAAAATPPLDGPLIRGVTVPHHLLAAELIARPLRLAAGRRCHRIVLLSPDHRLRSPAPAATTRRDFLTPLGRVRCDAAAAARLLDSPLAAESNLFSHEHGVQAVLPFLARLFPGVPVLPVALHARSQPADWQALAAALDPLVDATTLLVQSTDFSHYLPAAEARRRDAATLRVLATGDPDLLAFLRQPEHLDSLAAQWITLTLMRARGCRPPVVVDNRNALEFGGPPGDPRTTSYITQLHSPDFIPAAALPGEAWFFGGDTHFGRHLAELLARPAEAARIDAAVLAATGGRPLVLNLEGVLLETDAPAAPPTPPRIGMPAGPALDRLHRWHVRAAVLANNHTLDFGPRALAATRRLLLGAGIVPLGQLESADLGPFVLAAASDLANLPRPATALLEPGAFAAWPAATAKPLVAFLHCGREAAAGPDERVHLLARRAAAAGASFILGAHPHRPSPRWFVYQDALAFPSLGNLLFDQPDPRHAATLVELRFFPQSTAAARLIPLGNLYRGSAPE